VDHRLMTTAVEAVDLEDDRITEIRLSQAAYHAADVVDAAEQFPFRHTIEHGACAGGHRH
jgi:hypothetical protein